MRVISDVLVVIEADKFMASYLPKNNDGCYDKNETDTEDQKMMIL